MNPDRFQPHRRRRIVRWICAVLVLSVLGGAAYFGYWRFHLKRFFVVAPGKLIRTAQPTRLGIDHLVREYKVKTIICVRRESPRLCRGLFDLDLPDGPWEAEYVKKLGVHHLYWPMGGEAYWPWFGPQQYEQFFELFDDPKNLPAVVHCTGGRHRTGTFSALYRLEYDRWPVERVLEEMYSFDFGAPVPIQDHNLRTYLPRPLPTAKQWASLRKAFGPMTDQPADYATLVRRLRKADKAANPRVRAALRDYLQRRQPFAICLAQRVIDRCENPLAELATAEAVRRLRQDQGSAADWAMSAALVADFGSPAEQRELLDLMENEPKHGSPSPRYQAIVAGLTNRYTPNRLAFLEPALDDLRHRPEPAARQYRYCDTVVAHLISTADTDSVTHSARWDEAATRPANGTTPTPKRRVFHAFPGPCATTRSIRPMWTATTTACNKPPGARRGPAALKSA